jgi:hypothetical protein
MVLYFTIVDGSVKEYSNDAWKIYFGISLSIHAHLLTPMFTCSRDNIPEPCFLFKMSTHGLGSGVELVKIMTKRNLKTYWVMFNHIKRVYDWTTMGHMCIILFVVIC